MKRAVIMAVAASLAATSVSASDFSGLAEPSFARVILIGPQRQLEAVCVSMAMYRPGAVGNVAPADAKMMTDLVASRLIEEIGVEKDARQLLEDRAGWFDTTDADSAESKKMAAETLAEFAGKCAPLLDAYRAGGKAGFETKLLPSRGLIPLLSLPYCIALTEYVSARDPYPMFGKEQLADIDELAHHSLSDADRKSLDAAIDGERTALAKSKPDIEALGPTPIACLATFRQRAQQAYPERF